MSFNSLPPSVNKYLRPAVRNTGGRSYPYMYESREAKDFKKFFGDALKRKVKESGWDKSITGDGHWYLECSFVQKRKDEDPSNYLKILLDSLTGIVIEDDNNILPRVHRVSYNSKNPRFSIVLKRVEYVGLFNSSDNRDELIENQCGSCRFFREGKCSVLTSITDGKENDNYDASKNICFKFTERKSKK